MLSLSWGDRLRLWVLGLVLAATACQGDQEQRTPLEVYAASSLTDAFQQLERDFEATHPDVDVRLSFAGSQVLRLQIEQGARADVFASANLGHMQALVDAGHVDPSLPFAHNALVVIVPKDNPAGIASFDDLRRARKLVIGDKSVPVGMYTRTLFQRTREQRGSAFVAAIERHVVSEESNVRLIRAKVELGDADAAIVYQSDAVASDRVRQVPIPDAVNVRAHYPIGRTKRSAHPTLASEFIAYLRSKPGQAALARQGFRPEGE